ncbi:Spo11 [Columba livia]|nr:Spo11 [Columba livia]
MLLLKDSSEEEQLRLDLAFVKTVVFPAAQPSSISTHQCFLICAHIQVWALEWVEKELAWSPVLHSGVTSGSAFQEQQFKGTDEDSNLCQNIATFITPPALLCSEVLEAIENVIEDVLKSLAQKKAPVLTLANRSDWRNIEEEVYQISIHGFWSESCGMLFKFLFSPLWMQIHMDNPSIGNPVALYEDKLLVEQNQKGFAAP